MARRSRGRARRRGGFRRATSTARRYGSAAATKAREQRENVEGIAIAGLTGAVSGGIRGNRVKNGKPPNFELGDKKREVTVGEIALVGGAIGAVAVKNRKMSRRLASVAAGGAALTGDKFAFEHFSKADK